MPAVQNAEHVIAAVIVQIGIAQLTGDISESCCDQLLVSRVLGCMLPQETIRCDFIRLASLGHLSCTAHTV